MRSILPAYPSHKNTSYPFERTRDTKFPDNFLTRPQIKSLGLLAGNPFICHRFGKFIPEGSETYYE
jgi:hypothetical protein